MPADGSGSWRTEASRHARPAPSPHRREGWGEGVTTSRSADPTAQERQRPFPCTGQNEDPCHDDAANRQDDEDRGKANQGEAAAPTQRRRPRVIASLEEIRAWQRGVGTVTVIDVPDPIAPARVKAIRRKLARSVRLFSERFGLPANTVRQWEQGARRPDTASSLLLEVIDANPEPVEAAAKRRRQAA